MSGPSERRFRCAKCGERVERQDRRAWGDQVSPRDQVIYTETTNLPCGHIWRGEPALAVTADAPAEQEGQR